MTTDNAENETFEAFKNSFSYGSRTDLNFKFLKHLPTEEAARFFQDLLCKLGDTLDDADATRLIDHVREWQGQGYGHFSGFTYDDGPFTPLARPLAQSRLTLLTSTGHFVAGHDPEPFGVKEMTQEKAIARIGDFLKAAPDLSPIPFDTPPDQLRVRHGGYDIRGVQADPDVALPLAPLRELQQDGTIGSLTDSAYSFVGATAQTRLLTQSGPEWVEMLRQQDVDAALLVPV